MAKSKEFIESLPVYADKYIDYCLDAIKEVATGKGIQEIKERHLPTITFFLRIWLKRNLGETITRETYYEWRNSPDALKSDTIKNIDDDFKALAEDIVANEGKGIFYAKNKLGWSDKQENNTNLTVNQPVIIDWSEHEGENNTSIS